MASFTVRWSETEGHMKHGLLHGWRTVAIGASYRPMTTGQWERGARVIKGREIFPGLGRVACLTPNLFAGSVQLRHSYGKLIFVGIGVARGTAQSREMVDHLVSSSRRLMTIDACHRQVAAGKPEALLLVASDGHCGGLKCLFIMALLAMISARRPSKLTLMDILVAVHAECKLHLELSIFPSRHMALVTPDRGVFSA